MGGEDRDSEGAAVDDGCLALWVGFEVEGMPQEEGPGTTREQRGAVQNASRTAQNQTRRRTVTGEKIGLRFSSYSAAGFLAFQRRRFIW